MGRIVDVDGVPFDQSVLTEELATPQLTGVRQVWHASVAGGMTPDQLVAVLEGSISHDPRDLMTLSEEMEEREGHYFSVLSTRKSAVEGVPITIEAASEDAQDVKIADAVREMFKLDCMADLRSSSLDALGKAFSAQEIVWDTSERQWQPKKVLWRDQRWFQFDRDTLSELRLKDQADPVNGLPLAPFKYIVHRPRLKCGLPIRNGLSRIAAFSFLCKAFALKDWLAFCEVMGMPIRVGKYGPNASPKDVGILRRAVANIGTDAACVIPESMKIEFQQASNIAGAADMFERLCNYLDRQISKIVVGQTSTADAQATGMNSGSADVHNEVRGDIRDADGEQEARTYQQQLVRPFVDLNFGPQKRYPKVVILKPKQEDIKQLTDSLQKLVPLGLEVEQSVVRDKLGLPDPEERTADGKPVKLLKPQTVASIPPADRAGDAPALNRARNAALADDPSVVDQQTQQLASLAAPIVARDLLDPIQQMLDASTSFDDFRDKLLQAYPSMDTQALSELLAEGLMAAHVAGRYELLVGR